MSSTKEKLAALVEDEFLEIGGIKIYPFAAGRLTLLQLADSAFVQEEQKELSKTELLYEILLWLFVMSSEVKDVVKLLNSEEGSIEVAVLEMADKIKISDIPQITEEVKKAMARGGVALDYALESEGGPDPNR